MILHSFLLWCKSIIAKAAQPSLCRPSAALKHSSPRLIVKGAERSGTSQNTMKSPIKFMLPDRTFFMGPTGIEPVTKQLWVLFLLNYTFITRK